MQEKKYKLNDELTVERKDDPTGEDLTALKDLGFDPVFDPTGNETAKALMQCHYDKAKMQKLIKILTGNEKIVVKKGVSGKVVFQLLRDFFEPFGIRFQS